LYVVGFPSTSTVNSLILLISDIGMQTLQYPVVLVGPVTVKISWFASES
jgi:hypothetical protein